MRLTIESTPETGKFYVNGATTAGRIWLGTTEAGNQVLVFVTRIAAGPAAARELAGELIDATQSTKVINKPEPPGEPEWETMSEGGVDMDELLAGRRVERQHHWYRLVIDGHMVWIQPRPGYCDRGRYDGHYDGSFFIDAGDSFPRYYMDLETAKREMKAWLLHRLACERRSA